MFDEQHFADLDVVDHLEVFGNMDRAAALLGLSQSSCSRRYRSLSAFLDLGFDRIAGQYIAQRNHDVLAALRHAAQKLRVRRQWLRLSQGWEFPGAFCPSGWRPFPVPSMDTSQIMSLLDGRLLDVWFGGLLECQQLLNQPLTQLGPKRIALGQTLSALPLLRLRLVLLAHRHHPLAGRSNLTPDDLARFPSPALPMGAAPLLNCQLQQHGLATTPYGCSDYDPERWEAVACDGHTLVVAPQHRAPALEEQFQLVPLSYDLGLVDVGAVVGHRDVIADPCFKVAFEQWLALLKASPLAACPDLEWLV
jgi:DNA-binding transcriptional LysR family regulator